MSSANSALLLLVVALAFTQATATSPRRHLTGTQACSALPANCFSYSCTATGKVRVSVSRSCAWKQIVVIYAVPTGGRCGAQNCWSLDQMGANSFEINCGQSVTLLVRNINAAGTTLFNTPAVKANTCLQCGVASDPASQAEWCQSTFTPDCSTAAVGSQVCRAAPGPCARATTWTNGCACATTTTFLPATTKCYDAAKAGAACAQDSYCTGKTADCAPKFKPAGTVCRAAMGACDVPEVCDGKTLVCPKAVWTCSGKAGLNPNTVSCQKKKLL